MFLVGTASPMVNVATPSLAAVGPDQAAGLKNLQQLIQLRWMALFGQIATVAVVAHGMDIPIPEHVMYAVLAGLGVFNLLSLLRCRSPRPVTGPELLLTLLVDVGALTALLYLSGGATNPFVFLFLLQVILGAVLLPVWATWVMVGVTTLCFAGLALWAPPLPLPLDHDQGLASPYTQGMLICFVLNAVLLVVFISRIVDNLRERDTRLALLRQRAAEEEHVVRMGLLASGAAHELGTPLSTLAVILGDWQHLPHFTSDPELLQDVAEMQAQVLRCKSIVTGILQSAGEIRGEAPRETTLRAFVDDMLDEWTRSRPAAVLDFDNRVDAGIGIVSDTALRQMLFNVLDNALEASPERIALDARVEGDHLLLRVSDRGPGFPPAMLERLGKPYQSSKGAPGRGLGLFLSVNVARALGGTLQASNRAGGGAVVGIALPLQALSLEAGDDE